MNWLWIKIGILSVVTIIVFSICIYLILKSTKQPGLCNCDNPVVDSITIDDSKIDTNIFETRAMGIRSNVVKQGTHNISMYRIGNKVTIIVPYFKTETKQSGNYSYVKIPQEYLPKYDISFLAPLRIGGWLYMGFVSITVSTGELTLYYSNNGQADVNFPIGNIGNDTFCISYII